MIMSSNISKKRIREELKKTYINRSKEAWSVAGMVIKGRMAEALKDNPKLDKLLKLVVIANIGIWGTFLINIFKSFR